MREYEHAISHIPPKSGDSGEVRRQAEVHQKIEKLNEGEYFLNSISITLFRNQQCLYLSLFGIFCYDNMAMNMSTWF